MKTTGIWPQTSECRFQATGFRLHISGLKLQIEHEIKYHVLNTSIRNITCYTLKDFKNAKNENYYLLLPEHFLPSLTDKNG